MSAHASPTTQSQVHIVLGAGQVGPLLAAKLAAAGHDVRMVSRSRPNEVPGVRWVRADLADVAQARAAIRGAHTVYHCANPMRYDQWALLLPPMTNAICEAAAGSGAHLVVLDNLYMYGAPPQRNRERHHSAGAAEPEGRAACAAR